MREAERSFGKALAVAVDGALSYLEHLDEGSVGPTADLATLRKRLGRPLDDAGVEPDRVIEELLADVEGGIVGSAGGRFFAWVIGGAVPASLAADWLTSAWDQNAALYACGPAAAVVEEVAGAWLKELLGLPPQAGFAFATGCQMAHVTCLAAARHSLLRQRGWDVEEHGLYGAPPIQVLTSAERHGSIDRALRLLGLGKAQVRYLPTDAEGRVREEALQYALDAARSAPSIVLLQAGDINIGSFDLYERVVPLAKARGAWVHVDGAFGLWAAASPRYRHLVAGVEAADSWATDGHKWLNVPFDSGYAFVRDADAHRASMSHRAAYMVHSDDARDQIDWNPEWSRRARGFATYAALRQLGRQGVAAVVEGCCQHARSLVTSVGALPGAQLVWEPTINQGLVRFLDPSPGATEEDHDRWTDAVIAEITATGSAFFGGTTWRGRRAMRVSVVNWRTTEADVARAVSAVSAVLGRHRPSA